MNQEKIGKFLKELRKQKGLTQEQIAEKFHVSNRTISRWENGNNMPDLDILIELSDYYEVDLREILNGERKSGNMDKEMKETVLGAADYTNTEAERYNRRVRIFISFERKILLLGDNLCALFSFQGTLFL
ncbi:helix-turn-helix domain-containing protein [Petralouisia muris]|uniref:helix-turn-helix domain-containing protein n=1 Tax=Petralouisia muris TaxID=3032872 RepID=UPI00267BB612